MAQTCDAHYHFKVQRFMQMNSILSFLIHNNYSSVSVKVTSSTVVWTEWGLSVKESHVFKAAPDDISQRGDDSLFWALTFYLRACLVWYSNCILLPRKTLPVLSPPPFTLIALSVLHILMNKTQIADCWGILIQVQINHFLFQSTNSVIIC